MNTLHAEKLDELTSHGDTVGSAGVACHTQAYSENRQAHIAKTNVQDRNVDVIAARLPVGPVHDRSQKLICHCPTNPMRNAATTLKSSSTSRKKPRSRRNLEIVVALLGSRVASSARSTDFDFAAPMTMPAKHRVRALFRRNATTKASASLSIHLRNMAVYFRVFRLK